MGIPMYGQNKAGNSLGELDSILTASKTWDAGAIGDGNEEALEISVSGAALGDFVLCSLDVDVADLALSGAVTAADTVTLVLGNDTGGSVDLASTTANVMVIKK
tara:strand:- start:1091 stop:1402 length:312 start_codon:yes stop_codon:yes gene_type:complete